MEGRTQDRILSTLRHIKEVNNDNAHLNKEDCAVRCEPYVYYKEDELKWNGWGYADTEFRLGDEGEVILAGNKYSLSGKVCLFYLIYY